MKKIVGIIAALALAGSVFARPDITPVITEFKGDATLEWIADIDAETTGMKNSTSSSFKIQMRTDDWGGDSTSGDGLWGEVTVRTGGGYTAEKGGHYGWDLGIDVSEAKIHFLDGDTYFNMQILQPGFGVGELGYVLAYKAGNEWEDYKWGNVGGGYKYVTKTSAEEDDYTEVTVKDIYGATGDEDADKVVLYKVKKATKKTTVTETKNDYQGFTLNFGIPLVDFTLAFGDNGQQKAADKEFAWKAAATVKPIDGLKLYAGATGCTDDAYDMAMAFTASYNYKIDDQFYLKPAVQFTISGKKVDLGAAALFGWGDEGKQWRSDFLTFDNATSLNVGANSNRTADGVAVLFEKGIKNAAGEDAKTSKLVVEAFDSKLLADAGVTWGFAYRASGADEDIGKGAVDFAAIYNTNIDIAYLIARASFGYDLKASDFGAKWGLKVGTKELIANTDLYLNYVGSVCKFAPDNGCKPDANGLRAGTVTIGTKISF